MHKPDGFFPKHISENILHSWSQDKKRALTTDFPEHLSPEIKELLENNAITKLYKHQHDFLSKFYEGQNVVISTGTASGKSLCYQIPIIDGLLNEEESVFLLLFPTKALAADQEKKFKELLEESRKSPFSFPITNYLFGSYDGDTDRNRRAKIRQNARILLTNPDMLHIGILPQHPSWERFFRNLKLVILDEVHSYSGVFGSHVANILRRLKRIAGYYGSKPRFILSSATISNPLGHAYALTGENFELIDWDGSNKHRKDFYFINPPIVNKDLGVRKSIFDESLPVLKHLKEHSMQTIVFGRSRLTVENFLRASKYYFSGTNINLSAYRSGYTQQERRSIENRLKRGDLDVVISTIALELGIDMGMVDAIVMLGYPGSISGFLQQTGRAGREDRPSASVLIASASPVDQFIVHHPDFVAGKNPESVQINPDNPLILINHLKCAAFELPFRDQEGYGKLANAEVLEYLNVLMNLGMLHRDQRKYYWKSTVYPSSGFSIRGISGNPIQIIQKGRDGVKVIGEVDRSSAKRVVFPGAIYLHNGQSYEVLSLELEEDRAIIVDHHDDGLTIPIISIDIKIINSMESNSLQTVEIGFGEIEVTEEVSGYKKIIPETQEIIEKSNLDFEKDVMQTQGIWFAFEKPFVEQLNNLNLWTNSKNNYGPDWKDIRKAILKRDNFVCVLCGNHFPTTQLEVHHIKPFRTFPSIEEANHERNLAVLCSSCHKIAERNVRTVSLLNGFGHAFLHLSTILLKCNLSDISYSVIENIGSKNNMPGIVIYDQYPGGIGLSQHLFHNTDIVINWIEELLSDCECTEGCPACVGPPGENGSGAKRAVLEMVTLL